MKTKIRIVGIISIILTTSLFAMQAKASGREPIEGSQLEQLEKENAPLFDGFAEMDYCLFLETHLDYGVSLDYYRYGIYGDFVRTMQEGESVYLALNEKLIGNKLALCTHTEWYANMEPFIQNIALDLEWVISRKYTDVAAKLNIDKAYYQGQELEQKELEIGSETALFELQRKEGDGTYELMEEESLKRWDEITATVWGRKDSLPDFIRISISSIDEYGKLLAVAMPDNTGIVIYSMESGDELQYIDIADSIDTDWPLEVSQIKGTAESGWYVEELETGKKTCIYIEPWQEDYGSTICSGRCVWIQKDKLLQIVSEETNE